MNWWKDKTSLSLKEKIVKELKEAELSLPRGVKICKASSGEYVAQVSRDARDYGDFDCDDDWDGIVYKEEKVADLLKPIDGQIATGTDLATIIKGLELIIEEKRKEKENEIL